VQVLLAGTDVKDAAGPMSKAQLMQTPTHEQRLHDYLLAISHGMLAMMVRLDN
jgi:hypothetical protein